MLVFYKMQGGGNDFVIIDNRQQEIVPEKGSDIAKKLCERRFGIGADGLILIEPSIEHAFKWRFFNADGSVAEMCGNGARCAARFAFETGIAKSELSFETLAGVIKAKISGKEVAIKLTDPCDLKTGLHPSNLAGVKDEELTVDFVNTGVPHAVILWDDVAFAPVKELGRQIRYHEIFAPKGTNVNFVQILPNDRLKVRTYERGVEAETFACGTGSVASTIIAALKGCVTSPTFVETSGGEVLTVEFTQENGLFSDVWLKGPAIITYKGELQEISL